MEFNSALHTWSSIMHIRFARYVNSRQHIYNTLCSHCQVIHQKVSITWNIVQLCQTTFWELIHETSIYSILWCTLTMTQKTGLAKWSYIPGIIRLSIRIAAILISASAAYCVLHRGTCSEPVSKGMLIVQPLKCLQSEKYIWEEFENNIMKKQSTSIISAWNNVEGNNYDS